MEIGLGGCHSNKEEVFEAAWEKGIRIFDDGWGYSGKLENTKFLGQFLQNKKDYKVIEKLPLMESLHLYNIDLYNCSDEDLDKEIRRVFQIQLDTMNQIYFEYYLIHAVFDNQFKKEFSFVKESDLYVRVWKILNNLKEEHKIGHIGFSAHIPFGLLYRFIMKMEKYNCKMDVAEISYNLKNENGVTNSKDVWPASGIDGVEFLKNKGYTLINMMVTERNTIPAKEAYEFAKKAPFDIILTGTSNKKHLLNNIGVINNEL